MTLVTKKHLTNETKSLPLSVVQRLCDEQVLQGNKFNPSVFIGYIYSDKSNDGCDWDRTQLGYKYYSNIIDKGNFPKLIDGDLVWCPKVSLNPLVYMGTYLYEPDSDKKHDFDGIVFHVSKPNRKAYKQLTNIRLSWGIYE